MNLAEMLCYADIHQLNRIAKSYQCECDGHSKNELIQSILSRILRKESFLQQMDTLEREDVQFLQSLLFDPQDRFSIEELMARANHTLFQGDEDRSPREMITNLVQKGWLFPGISHQTRALYQIPADVKKKVEDALRQQIQKRLPQAPEPPIYRDEEGLLIEDIRTFLTYISKNDVLLTGEGNIYKRQQQSILDKFHVREEPIRHRGWRFGYGRRFKEYPDRFSFIYDYCYYTGDIVESDLRLDMTASGLVKLNEGKLEDPSAVYRFWLRLYRGPIRNLQPLVRLIEFGSSRWVKLGDLQQVLLPYIKEYYYDDRQAIIDKRMIPMLLHLGILKVGQDEEGQTVVCLTRNGSNIIQGIAIAEEDIIRIDTKADRQAFLL
jgi:hypothetical protein